MEVTSTLIGERGFSATVGAEHGAVRLHGVPGAEAREVTVGLRRSAYGVFWPAMLAVRSGPGKFTAVTDRAVRRLCVPDKNGDRPLDRALAVAVAKATLGSRAAHNLDTGWTRRRRGGGSTAFSRLVAMIYNEAVAVGLPPRPVVAAVWGRSLDCVDNWVSEARRHRALGRDPLAFRPGRPRFRPLNLTDPRSAGHRERLSAQARASGAGAIITHVPGFFEWRFRVELRWAKDGSARCRGVVIEPAEAEFDVVITPRIVAELPLTEVISHGREIGTGNLLVPMARMITGPLHTNRGREHARQVTAVYRFALEQGVPPLPLISNVWDRDIRTARTWTSNARRMGILPAHVLWSSALRWPRRPTPE